MLHKSLIRIIVFLIIASVGPAGLGSLWGQEQSTGATTQKVRKKRPPATSDSQTKSTAQPTTRKKPTSSATSSKAKTRSTSARPASQRPTSSQSGQRAQATRKKTPANQAKTAPATSSQRQPTARTRRPAEQEPAKPPIPKVNTLRMANDIYLLTDELTSTSREMELALSYLQPLTKRSAVRLESQPQISLVELESKADQNPDDIKAQHQLAKEYERLQRYDQAKDIYLRMVYRQPYNADTHYYLGTFYKATAASQKARQAFEQALVLDPDHPAATAALGRFPGTLEPQTDKAPTSALNQPMGRISAIRREMEAGNYQATLELSAAARAEFPQQAGFCYLEGLAYSKLGRPEKAKLAYLETTRLEPDHLEAHQALADLYFADGSYLYAALSSSQVVRLDPMSIPYRFQQGMAFFLAAEWGRAAASWEDLLHYAPGHAQAKFYLPQVYYIMATEYNRQGQAALGREAFTRALGINNNAHTWLPGALTTLGKNYREKGLYKESLASLQEVIELQPKAAAAYTELGITYWKMNESRLARAAWQRSLEIQPDNNEAQGWLILSRQSG